MSINHLRSCAAGCRSLRTLRKVVTTTPVSRNYHVSKNILKLSQRGMYEDMLPDSSSNEIIDLLTTKPQCVYAGFDPTASSLHIGNLLILKNLMHWQRSGHKVIALIGVGTAQIGDPSGRTKDREKQDTDKVREQGYKIQKNIQTIFDNHEKYFWSRVPEAEPLTPIKFLNNEDWYKNINVIDFMNTIVRHFRMGPMLLKDSVNRRIQSEDGMCCTEFMYQVFQAYDWYHLFKTHDCKFQIGGKDQMGNIESGHKLIRRLLDKPSYGLTLPLLTNTSGEKLGKSAQNSVWLDPQLTRPYYFYKFFLRTSNSLIAQLLKLFSFDSVANITSLLDRHFKNPENHIAQTALAEELTLLVHGEEGLENARHMVKALVDADVEVLAKLTIEDLKTVIPDFREVNCRFRTGYSISEFLVDIQCFPTKTRAISMIENRALYINQRRAMNANEILSQSVHILPNNTTIVRVGKTDHVLVKWTLSSH